MRAKMIGSIDAVFNENSVYYFKKEFEIKKKGACTINISADARYKVWINGRLAAIGPCKGSAREKYYDTVDIAPYLEDGKNVITAQVLQLTSCDYEGGHRFLCSVYRTGNMMFMLWGSYEDAEEIKYMITDSSWLCAKDPSMYFKVPKYAFYAGINEVRSGFAQLDWKPAKELAPVLCAEDTQPLFYGEIGNWFMAKRPIPMMTLIPKTLSYIGGGVYDAGELTTGIVKLRFSGKGKMKLTYGECFVHIKDGSEIKDRRDDTDGVICGDYDMIDTNGSGDYETIWFKTFRYIMAEPEGSAKIEEISYIDVCYPLNVSEDYDFGSDADNMLWDMSVRTLRRCMHETYEDCPYYEQLQYVYDTSIQMIYTYQISNDDRLARKLMHDFAQSYHFGSTVQSRFPSASVQYIAEFPMFFIYMIGTHYQRFGDAKLVKDYLHIIDGVLLWYEKNTDASGLIKRTIFWEYIDWADGWNDNRGCPQGKGPLTVQNMLYIGALRCAAFLNHACGRGDTAREYSEKAKVVSDAVNQLCYDCEEGIYYDSTDRLTFSQHPQIWAVLNDMVGPEQGKTMLEKSFKMKARATFGYVFWLFRALEKTGLYDMCEAVMDDLRDLIKLGCTTIPETPKEARSECHGWGSVALYEFTAKVLGVEVLSAAKKQIRIKPYIKGRERARGRTATIWGDILVDWKKQKGEFFIQVILPDGLSAELVMPSGKIKTVTGRIEDKERLLK